MSLIRRNRYDPFFDFDRVLDRMRSVMDIDWPGRELVQRTDANVLAVDMTSDENTVTVRIALPGFSEDEVKVDVQNNLLTITAESRIEREDKDEDANWHMREMRYGKFARSIHLPEQVTTDKAEATLENGILTVTLPKEKPGVLETITVKARNLLKGDEKKAE